MLELQNITKIYGDKKSGTRALVDINLTVERGEFLAIIGESGSGKSTLLNILGALDSPTSGLVLLDGENLAMYTDKQLSAYRNKNIGFIFQDFYLDPQLTVFQNIEIPLLINNVPKAMRQKRVAELLKKVALAPVVMSKKISMLSGGEKQRVALVRALANDPKLLLADEPTGNLDKANGENIIALLKALNADGITIVMVTHNLAHTSECDRVVEMLDGKIVGIHAI